MRRLALCALLAAVLFATPAPARGATRSPRPHEPCDLADSLLFGVHGWQDLHRVYPVVLPCDDGYIAEGASEIVVHFLATRWKTFPELAAMAEADTAFGSWVVLHIDATTDWDELSRIERHARGRGPERFAVFRARVGAQAHGANVEAHEAAEEALRVRYPGRH